jgi:hypothetical protein
MPHGQTLTEASNADNGICTGVAGPFAFFDRNIFFLEISAQTADRVAFAGVYAAWSGMIYVYFCVKMHTFL